MAPTNKTKAYDDLSKRVAKNLNSLIKDDNDLLYMLGAGVLIESMFLRFVDYEDVKEYCLEEYGEVDGMNIMNCLSLSVIEVDRATRAFNHAFGGDENDVEAVCLTELLMREVTDDE